MINATIQDIKNKRTDEKFKEKFDQSFKIAALKVPRIRRKKKMPEEAADDEYVTDPYERFKVRCTFQFVIG